ncbi:hypothetical protein AWB80_06168 [Caballeronia pedi]|uniref:Uncharacterized protein n=1 Tax=Caballeronia pedi TaxID=1777141 RepID=A0A158D227_9BURK|nr:hypothetical protein AWB80_06168 [Caballeronia pedi]
MHRDRVRLVSSCYLTQPGAIYQNKQMFRYFGFGVGNRRAISTEEVPRIGLTMKFLPGNGVPSRDTFTYSVRTGRVPTLAGYRKGARVERSFFNGRRRASSYTCIESASPLLHTKCPKSGHSTIHLSNRPLLSFRRRRVPSRDTSPGLSHASNLPDAQVERQPLSANNCATNSRIRLSFSAVNTPALIFTVSPAESFVIDPA